MEFNNNNSSTSSRSDRKFIERNRRNQMKALYSELHSLVRRQTSREVISVSDQLEEATSYIKRLQMKLERMKEKKYMLKGINRNNSDDNNDGSLDKRRMKIGLRSPQIEIHHMGSALAIAVITGLDCQFIFNEIVRVLHGEAADIVNAGYTVSKDAVFYTIHCQVGESRDNVGRISERLKILCGSGAF